jgi:MerR family transcriptional regulator, copper efflux regulator
MGDPFEVGCTLILQLSDYDDSDIHRLQFIRRARDLGFSFERVRELLKLWSNRGRSSGVVKALAVEHIANLETRAAELREMIQTLRHLAESCDGGDHPDCPIIHELEVGPVSQTAGSLQSRRGRKR